MSISFLSLLLGLNPLFPWGPIHTGHNQMHVSPLMLIPRRETLQLRGALCPVWRGLRHVNTLLKLGWTLDWDKGTCTCLNTERQAILRQMTAETHLSLDSWQLITVNMSSGRCQGPHFCSKLFQAVVPTKFQSIFAGNCSGNFQLLLALATRQSSSSLQSPHSACGFLFPFVSHWDTLSHSFLCLNSVQVPPT